VWPVAARCAARCAAARTCRHDGRQAEPADAACARLQVGGAGLAPDQARQRRSSCGPNRLAATKPRGALRRFVLQGHDVLRCVMPAAAAITALPGHRVDTVVLLAAVVANAVIGLIREGRGAPGSTPPSWCPATSCGSPRAIACRPTCGSSASTA